MGNNLVERPGGLASSRSAPPELGIDAKSSDLGRNPWPASQELAGKVKGTKATIKDNAPSSYPVQGRSVKKGPGHDFTSTKVNHL